MAVVAVAGATSTDATGPILAFVGAILVALVAAYTAGRRQARSLTAESERHRETLAAERERLQRQLDHDREIADLADLRALFDRAATALADASAALGRLESGVYTEGKQFIERARPVWEDARLAIDPMPGISERLGVRLEADHAAVVAFTVAEGAATHVVGTVAGLPTAPDEPSREWWAVVAEGHVRLLAAKADFMRAAVETVGARLP